MYSESHTHLLESLWQVRLVKGDKRQGTLPGTEKMLGNQKDYQLIKDISVPNSNDGAPASCKQDDLSVASQTPAQECLTPEACGTHAGMATTEGVSIAFISPFLCAKH